MAQQPDKVDYRFAKNFIYDDALFLYEMKSRMKQLRDKWREKNLAYTAIRF